MDILRKFTGYSVTPISLVGSEEEHFAVMDNYGHITTKKELNEILDAVKSFYTGENVDVAIIKHNKQKDLHNKLDNYCQNYSQQVDKDSNGLYNLPTPNYKYKQFNPEKRDWSCTCNWCGNKVSSKEDDGYYTIYNSTFNIVNERACTKACIELIWKDKLKEWIYDNEYQEFFVLGN